MRDNPSLREILLTLWNSLSILHQFLMATPLPAAAAVFHEEAMHEDVASLEPKPSEFHLILKSSISSFHCSLGVLPGCCRPTSLDFGVRLR